MFALVATVISLFCLDIIQKNPDTTETTLYEYGHKHGLDDYVVFGVTVPAEPTKASKLVTEITDLILAHNLSSDLSRFKCKKTRRPVMNMLAKVGSVALKCPQSRVAHTILERWAASAEQGPKGLLVLFELGQMHTNPSDMLLVELQQPLLSFLETSATARLSLPALTPTTKNTALTITPAYGLMCVFMDDSIHRKATKRARTEV